MIPVMGKFCKMVGQTCGVLTVLTIVIAYRVDCMFMYYACNYVCVHAQYCMLHCAESLSDQSLCA